MKLSNSRHPDVPGNCVSKRDSKCDVTSTVASQPVDELHVSRLYTAATYPWLELEEFN